MSGWAKGAGIDPADLHLRFRGHPHLVGRERCRRILRDHHVTFQRTKFWKECHDPDRGTKLDRIEHVMNASRTGCLRSSSWDR